MQFYSHTTSLLSAYLEDEYSLETQPKDYSFQPTRKEFEGNFTLVVFPLSAKAKKKPEDFGKELGDYLLLNSDYVDAYNVVKGFLNITLSLQFWRDTLLSFGDIYQHFQHQDNKGKLVLEYSSPNTNKPLHLGHIRNILLGWSLSKIKARCGHEVIKTQIVNDRGVAICKSMLAWKKFAKGETPESSDLKGDHLIGKYYVIFDRALSEEYAAWQETEDADQVFREKGKKEDEREAFFKNYKNQYFNEFSSLGAEVRKMLIDWEKGEPETIALWKKMNSWVYAGFDETYKKLGVDFDKTYYESDTYQLGKNLVEQGLNHGLFYKKEDGSVWVDLTDVGMDEKLLLRGDGTSVYITQDLGTARIRHEDFGMNQMTYVVGNEQDYHFKVLFEVLKKIGESYAEGLFHLSYGMVDLPSGKMKSREGNVVDADDLIAEVIATASKSVEEREGMDGLSEEEKAENIRRIAMGALKYHLLRVNPRKRMLFDPEESLEMQGHTGPYVQNAFVRIRSILRKVDEELNADIADYLEINAEEKELLILMLDYSKVVETSAVDHDPSHLANFLYQLAKTYHRFYHEHHIVRAESAYAKNFRLKLSSAVAAVLEDGMDLLGISMPERM